MVNPLSQLHYHFLVKDDQLELIAQNKNICIRATTPNSAAILTPKKVQSLLKDLFDKKILDLAKTSSDKLVLTKDQHHIAGLDSDIVLEVLKVRKPSIIGSAVRLFQSIVGLVFGKKSAITLRATHEFKEILRTLPKKVQSKIEHQLKSITKDELQLLHFLGTKVAFKDETQKIQTLLEILNGGYIVFEDGGKTYEEWVKLFASKHFRLSSHESNDKQYAIRGPLVKEGLFSKKTIKHADGTERQVTWMQLERYPVDLVYALPHLCSWVLYKVTGKNQGPLGSSVHTEKHNPLILKLL